MNTVVVDYNDHKPQPGDIFIDDSEDGDNDLFILATVDYYGKIPKYQAINLSDGNRWRDVSPKLNEAIEGLRFYRTNAVITVK